ncbi:RDD family protein [Occallatibacter riparius]|uniref:RDD family protein n=1 Tax=Occallatibacter riparius TaxID=1002689 RepID=A0A9J7BNZ7_9BACT|nr:RDD family protein [Occallatibacter riparius]UWZ84343.1 RDD family protein [Occallatibacter riparius]
MNPGSDQLSIDTPELVSIELPLAGIGSRFIAVLVDTVLWFVALIVVIFLISFVGPAIAAFNKLSYQWTVALVIFLLFLFNWGYFTLFEAFWNGRTPGKKIAKIRVIQKSGRPIGLFESMARNFIRYIDQIPSFYAVGVITMFITKQHQRLGDLAAGTLVVQDREQEAPLWGESGSRTFTAASFTPTQAPSEPHTRVVLPAGGISKLTSSDLEVLEGFFARRLDMPLEVRQKLADRICAALIAKSGLEIPEGVSVETFLEAAARDLRDLARMR